MFDNGVNHKDGKLSLTSYSNSCKMLNKDKMFELHIFGLGY